MVRSSPKKRKKERKKKRFYSHSPSLYLDQFDVVCRQHSGEAGPLDASGHPAGVDRVDLDDEVALGEAHLVTVLGLVVVDRTVDSLQFFLEGRNRSGKNDYDIENVFFSDLVIVGEIKKRLDYESFVWAFEVKRTVVQGGHSFPDGILS